MAFYPSRGARATDRTPKEDTAIISSVRGCGIVCAARLVIIGPFLLYSGIHSETKRVNVEGIKDSSENVVIQAAYDYATIREFLIYFGRDISGKFALANLRLY